MPYNFQSYKLESSPSYLGSQRLPSGVEWCSWEGNINIALLCLQYKDESPIIISTTPQRSPFKKKERKKTKIKTWKKRREKRNKEKEGREKRKRPAH